MFRNSFRLFCANFDKVWKYLIYQLLCWGIIFALLAPFYNTISSCITSVWQDFNLAHYFGSGTLYGISILEAFSGVINAVVAFFSLVFSTNLGCAIYILAILFLVRPVLTNVGRFALQEMIYKYMSSSSKSSFTGCLLGTLKKSLPLACLKALYTLPFEAACLASIYGLTRVTEDWFAYVLPFAVVILPALLLAVKETFGAGWIPARIVLDDNAFLSYKEGIVAVLRCGAKIFSTAFVIYLLMLVLAMVIGLYSLIIILPCISPVVCIFEMVAFFSSQGMRFYVDSDTIISPKKLEEVDKIEKAKYLL